MVNKSIQVSFNFNISNKNVLQFTTLTMNRGSQNLMLFTVSNSRKEDNLPVALIRKRWQGKGIHNIIIILL